VSWGVEDPESGIASQTGCNSTTLSTDSAGTTLTCSATNGAGLSASASTTIKIDKTPPSITLTSPASGANYLLNATAAANYSCSDGLSGLVACSGVVTNGSRLTTATVGTKDFTVNASDRAGNSATLAHDYSVRYGFTGFLSPVDNAPLTNVASAGKSIPVKWRLRDATGAGVTDLSSLKSLTSGPIACGTTPRDVAEATVITGGTVLRYDATSSQFIYNWQTLKSWTGCRALQLTLSDGAEYFAIFSFK
jgi:hypothetical protein